MIETLVFLLLTVLSVIAVISIVILAIYRIIATVMGKANTKQIKRLNKTAVFLAVVVILNVALVTFTQITTSTPLIKDANGNIPGNSISELTELELNGRKQWISLRGWDKSKPILLFLAGGPGGTQIAAVRHELSELEKHFVVVNWDQPGSGKSYYSDEIKDISVETYIQDGYALTEYLKKRFSKEKIYLMGESWGSALGIFLIDRFPDSYHAFIGTGQMIDFAETEKIDYKRAMEIASERNDEEIVKQLKANGAPPYYGNNITWKSAVYLNYLSNYMGSNVAIHNSGYNTFRDIVSTEYGLLDKINYVRGIINTFNDVYQQLYDVDLRTDYIVLDVPVYFFIGRHDINAPTYLVEEYVELLDAPHKEIVWFEHSGHSPWINEREKFVKEVLSCLLEKQ